LTRLRQDYRHWITRLIVRRIATCTASEKENSACAVNSGIAISGQHEAFARREVFCAKSAITYSASQLSRSIRGLEFQKRLGFFRHAAYAFCSDQAEIHAEIIREIRQFGERERFFPPSFLLYSQTHLLFRNLGESRAIRMPRSKGNPLDFIPVSARSSSRLMITRQVANSPAMLFIAN